VAIPGTDGRAGMATVVTDDELDLAAFRTHLISRLPGYARPVFLRVRNEMAVSATFRTPKNDLVHQGYDPITTADVIYFDAPERGAFIRLDKALYDRIHSGQIRF
jgi:fatty-acyl-CoA synthase